PYLNVAVVHCFRVFGNSSIIGKSVRVALEQCLAETGVFDCLREGFGLGFVEVELIAKITVFGAELFFDDDELVRVVYLSELIALGPVRSSGLYGIEHALAAVVLIVGIIAVEFDPA